MSELVYVDDWSSLHIFANLALGMFTGARHYNFWATLTIATAAGLGWEIFEELYPDSHETVKDHVTDMLINTIGFVTGYALGDELKR